MSLDLFPDSTAVESSELSIGGVRTTDLVDRHGTPLVVYCEQTLRARARAYRQAAPEASILYSVKAFPNVAVMRLFVEEGLGAEASTLGELAYAQAAGIGGDALVVDGNNKSDEELTAAARTGGMLVLDAPDDAERAAAAGVRRVLVRVTPGIDADTHWAIATGHRGSKFGLTPEQASETLERCRDLDVEAEGLHVHIGSQLLGVGAERMTIDWLAAFAADSRAALDWTPKVVDLGGGLGIPYTEEDPRLAVETFVTALVERLRHAWSLHDLPQPRVVLEPGRSLVGQAGVTLYRVGAVKQASENVTYVAVDGGMSDNPRPQLYGARHTALLASRASEPASGTFAICGKHCESGDVMIERAALAEPRRGDILAVASTGAYTLGMSSNYNAVPRPAAVLVSQGVSRVIRHRETVEDLLRLESE